MQVGHIGIAGGVGAGPRKMRQLAQNLTFFREEGFQLVEISVTNLGLILHGELRHQAVAEFVAVLRDFDLRYTLHAPNRLNLAYDSRPELCQQIMRGLIEICRAAAIERMVYHSGLQALDEVRYGVRRSLLTNEELRTGAQREVNAFRILAPVAADAGVTIGMENGDPHLWEHNLMAQFGLPHSALLQHHARLQPGPIIAQLAAIEHPNIRMTLDLAHLYIAANELGFDYQSAIVEAAPWVCHLHLNDNFGLLDRGFDSEAERWAFGEADLHLPPGWGAIPYAEAFRQLPNYRGDIILEIKAGFLDAAAAGRGTIEQILQDL